MSSTSSPGTQECKLCGMTFRSEAVYRQHLLYTHGRNGTSSEGEPTD
jgi:hypothetical protein